MYVYTVSIIYCLHMFRHGCGQTIRGSEWSAGPQKKTALLPNSCVRTKVAASRSARGGKGAGGAADERG